MSTLLRLGAVAIVAAVVALATSACDWFTTFTVVNQTDAPLFAMAYMEDCSTPLGKRQDYLHEEMVQPGELREYSETNQAAEPKCVMALGLDRTLVFAAPYESGQKYTLEGPVHAVGPVIPERAALPAQTFREKIDDLGQLQIAAIAVVAALAGMLALLLAYAMTRAVVRLVLRPA